MWLCTEMSSFCQTDVLMYGAKANLQKMIDLQGQKRRTIIKSDCVDLRVGCIGDGAGIGIVNQIKSNR